MPLQSGIYPSTTASFIVQNNSSIKRTIKVFGVKLNPGQTLDLMRIPGVTEEDIRAELTKGGLKALFAGGTLAVVSSSINVSSASTAHQQFLYGIGLSDRIFRSQPVFLRGVAPDGPPGTNPYVPSGPQSITLPDNAKISPAAANVTLLAYVSQQPFARAVTGGGALGVIANLATTVLGMPTTQKIMMSPSGDLLLLPSDGFTSIDICYFPELQDPLTVICAVNPATGVVTLPSPFPLLVSIMEAEALVGGVVGKQNVMAPVGYSIAAVLTTKQTCLSAGKLGVTMCVADAVTSVRLKLGVVPTFY